MISLNPSQIESTNLAVIESRTLEIGRELFRRIGRGPSPLQRAWWDDRLMDLTMDRPEVKVQLFRFIDALPTLKEPSSVRRHLTEYLGEAGTHVPPIVKLPTAALSQGGPTGDQLLATLARTAATRMGRRFIAGSTPAEAFQTVLGLRRQRFAFTADLLGEAVITEAEAEAYQETCLQLLSELSVPLQDEPEIAQIDRDSDGPIPRANLSVKLTSLTARFDPMAQQATTERVLNRLRPILRTAMEVGAFVNVDMEQEAYKELASEIVKRVLIEPEFRAYPHFGIVCQAYLRDAEDDLQKLRDWAMARGTPITVRLVKGAYWDYEVLHATKLGWPIPVYTSKWESDASFERCTKFLMENRDYLRTALGSHNIRSLAHGIAVAEAMGMPIDSFELQVLHGMGDVIGRALMRRGHRVRVYSPYGAMLPGMAYLVRRLLENTSNESFLKVSSHGDATVNDLLRNPEEIGSMKTRERRTRSADDLVTSLPPFANQPPVDFSVPENQVRMSNALGSVHGELGRDYPILIGNRSVSTENQLTSESPNDTSIIVGRSSMATRNHAHEAVGIAQSAVDDWSSTSVETRANVLRKAAQLFRDRLFELAAWQVIECGKPWNEATADVDEAIDFCEFYARQMLELAIPLAVDVAGETNRLEYFGRGVTVVIPPWNFPMAIPCGMVAAALVSGCPVILKPAEQSTICAWQIVQVLREAGVPPDVLQFLPGIGEEVGAALVDDPRVAVIAFTGSKEVGLSIYRTAADTKPGQSHVKRVIAEMGGKNAIIVDDDADLDEAVVGVLYSAFGYAGQKCSAGSRASVLEGVYDAFLARLSEALKSWPVGSAEDPDTAIPPVISAESRNRIEQYKQIAASEGRVVADLEIGDLREKGHYVGPLIVADVDPQSRIAQEEVFGPILAVLKAKDLDEALEIANGVEYALTGGLYSRSPKHIQQVKDRFRVGNLYINRSCAGALVNRQPFGGFKLSGIGTKAGGRDYLLEFLLARNVTENTMRRGFAPEIDELTVPSGASLPSDD